MDLDTKKLNTKKSADDPADDDDVDAADSVVKAEDEDPSPPADEQDQEDDGADQTDEDQSRRVKGKSGKPRRQLTVSLRTVMFSALVVALVAAVAVMTWLYMGARSSLDSQKRQAADTAHAEQVALDYAVNAAIMDYKDLAAWKQNIVKGTTRELTDKLTKAATAMEQIVAPLQWTSTAKPLAAKTRSHDKGLYVVDAFVSVMTKTVQATDTLQSTATYSVTLDSNNSWLVTDVGGIAAVVDK